jgi:hypothetical protein
MKTKNTKITTTFAMTFLAITLLMMPATSGTAFANHTTTVSPSGESTVAYNGNCYAFISGDTTFSNAFTDAQSKSVNGVTGHLATLDSTAEETAVDSTSALPGWIGFTQDPAFYGDAGQLGDGSLSNGDAGWGWVTGEPVVYTNWQATEPNDNAGGEAYAENNRFDGNDTWNDLKDTDNRLGYYVEFDGACPDVDDEVCDDSDQLCKTVVITEDDVDGIITVNELIRYDFTIDLNNNDGQTWYHVILQDHGFGADLNVGDPVIVDKDSDWSADDMDLDNLDCELTQSNNKSHKEKLDCIVDSEETFDDIDPSGVDHEFSAGEHASVSVTAYTDINPGQGKKDTPKREYTSCGIHSPNSGADVEYYLDDQKTNGPYFLETPAIYVEVYDYNLANLALGDCDDDTVNDAIDNCPFTPNAGQEDNYGTDLGDACEDTDSDTILDDIDKCPEDAEDVDGIDDADGCPDTEVSFLYGWDSCSDVGALACPFGNIDENLNLANSYVSYSTPSNGLDVSFHFEGADASRSYQVGIHYFPGDIANCLGTFGGISAIVCSDDILRQSTTEDIEAFEFGTLTTNGSGDGEADFWLTGISADTYDVQFHVREGVGCIAGGNCAVIFQAPGPFGTTESITIP